MSGVRSFKIILWKGSKLKINRTKKNLNSVWDLSDKQRLIVLFTTGRPHCSCNWLLFYSKCIGFTVCLTDSDVLLSLFINKHLIKVELPYLWYIVVLLPWRRVFQRFWRILSLPFTVPDLYGLDCIEGWFTATRIPLIKTHPSLVYYISSGLTLALTRLLPRSSEGYALQCTRIPPQVAQARNMSIGEYRHCCVTFRI